MLTVPKDHIISLIPSIYVLQFVFIVSKKILEVDLVVVYYILDEVIKVALVLCVWLNKV